MTHVIDHIICGGAGECIGEKQILIWDHTALNVAVNLKHDGLLDELIKAGMRPEKAQRKVGRYGRRIHRFFEELYDDLADDGVPVETYEPHEENMK